MLLTDKLHLGAGKISQISIGEKVDFEKFTLFLKKNLEFFVNINKEINDNYSNKLIDYIKENNKYLEILINKHVEIYTIKNFSNPEKIFRYLVFRLKFLIAGREKVNIGYPPYLLIEPVSTCNLRCPFCFQVDKSFTKKPYMGVMKLDLFKKIIDEANEIEIGAITLASRGEPTLHKELDSMLDYVSTKKNIFEIKLNTNATFLTEKICHSIFKNNLSQVVISADHYLKEEYERLRVNSNFEKIIKNVDMLYDLRKKDYPNSVTEIRVSGIDNEKNLDKKKFRDFWIQRSDHVTSSYPLERWDTYANSIHEHINDPCENLWDRMYIWFDGTVNPCDADYKSHLTFGNFGETSIKKIWNSDKIEKLRQDHLNNLRNKNNPCDRCGVTFK
jgi:radical SAM protein with 4Fe4S-binding SPASM domain